MGTQTKRAGWISVLAIVALLAVVATAYARWGGRTGGAAAATIGAPAPPAATWEGTAPEAIPFTTCGEDCTHGAAPPAER
jgi:hypothetical protein